MTEWERQVRAVPDPPPLEGRDVLLRPVEPADATSMRLVELSIELGPRWRFRGATPSPEEWTQSMSGTLAQFVVVEKASGNVIGIVQIHGASFQDGYAELSAAKIGGLDRSPLLMFGVVMFVRYVFSCWNFRKLYMQVPEFNFSQIESGVDKFFFIEGRLRDHLFAYGRSWDQFQLAIYRDRWLEHGQALLDSQDLS